jgi:hypothetical protein
MAFGSLVRFLSFRDLSPAYLPAQGDPCPTPGAGKTGKMETISR